MLLNDLKKIFGNRTKALEILYMFHGSKPLVRQGFYDAELGKIKEFCNKNNLFIEIAPYKVVLADPHQRFSNKGFKVRTEDPRRGMFFAYISKDEKTSASGNAFEFKNDHKSLGLLLGYPECCVDFFCKHEPKRSRMDNDYVIPALENSRAVRFSFLTNINIRNKDITLLNHFPCSFECKASIDLGRKHLRLISELDPNLAMHFTHELKQNLKIGDRTADFTL